MLTYNYSYREIKNLAGEDPNNILLFSYLHFRFGKEINLKALGIPIKWIPDDVVIKRYNKTFSYFSVVPDCYIRYSDVVLRTDITVQSRVYYLYLASLTPIYYPIAWIPDAFILKDTTELINKKLAVKKFEGLELIKEKRFDEEVI